MQKGGMGGRAEKRYMEILYCRLSCHSTISAFPAIAHNNLFLGPFQHLNTYRFVHPSFSPFKSFWSTKSSQ